MRSIMLNNLYGGPVHYLGNRSLSLPDNSGYMKIDRSWLIEQFEIVFANNQGKKYARSIEPFAGSASWSLAAMELELAEEYVINDSDKALINVHKLIKENPEKIKEAYSSLCKEYEKIQAKEDFFYKIINDYNKNESDCRPLLLPFIINHSWSGIISHDNIGNIIYQKKLFSHDKNKKHLDRASLSIEKFCQEVDWASKLFNKNKVHFYYGDFQTVIQNVNENDFVMLNPPYPENERSNEDKTSMYTELYSPNELHQNLLNFIQKLEEKNAHYIMTYGFYNPKMNDFVVRGKRDQLRNFFRILGYNGCAFGVALDQIYYSSCFIIPEKFKHKIIPAVEITANALLSEQEALEKFLKMAEKV